VNRDAIEGAIDRLEAVEAALGLPISNTTHVDGLRELLPEIIAELKAGLDARRTKRSPKGHADGLKGEEPSAHPRLSWG
jgi:hypothetical protein